MEIYRQYTAFLHYFSKKAKKKQQNVLEFRIFVLHLPPD